MAERDTYMMWVRGKGTGEGRDAARENGCLLCPLRPFFHPSNAHPSAPVATMTLHSRRPPSTLANVNARAPLLAGGRAIGPGPRHHRSGHTDKSPSTRARSQKLAVNTTPSEMTPFRTDFQDICPFRPPIVRGSVFIHI